jgi:GeoRSP system SPASM domain protein
VELRSPIRLYWDITPAPSPEPDYIRICSELASSRSLTIHLTDLGEILNSNIAEIISLLSVSTMAISLTVSHKATAEALPLFARGLRRIYVDVRSTEDIRSVAASGVSGVSFRSSCDNHHLLPDIIACCIETGIAELQLPMERLILGAEPLCLSRAEREALAVRIKKIPFAGQLTMTANDPFLWRVVQPGIPFPDGICQAANTMLAIAPNGDLYPCPAMPVLLGNLQTAKYHEIIASTLKKELRGKILARPAGCSFCNMLDFCRGGCRGRGLHTAGSLDAADPGCGEL